MSGRIARVGLGAGVLATPALGTLLLVHACLGASLRDFVPGAVNDEILYWHQILTFKEVGWGGGYYTAQESIAPARFSHFYLHGPAFPILYGGPARLFGWELHAPPFYNLAVVSLGVGVWLWLVRPTAGRLLAFGAVLASFWPLFFFIPSAMQESVHQALALCFAGCLAVLIERPRGRGGPLLLAGFALLVALAAFLRPTWLLLWVALLGVLALRLRPSALVLAGLAAGVLVLAGLLGAAAISLSAPLPRIDPALPNTPTNFGSGVELADLVWRLRENLSLFTGAASGIAAHPVSRWSLLEVPLLLGVLLVAAARAWRRRHRAGAAGQQRLAALFAHAVSLGGSFAFAMLLYDAGDLRGVRITSPHLLLSLALLAALCELRLLLPFAVYQGLLLVPFLDLAATYRSKSFDYDVGKIAGFRSALAPFVAYDARAPSPWCNTLLASGLPRWLLGTPPGIGISFLLANSYEMRLPPSSQYLVLHARHRDWLEQGVFYGTRPGPLHLEPLGGNEFGGLYRNLDAPCSRPPPPVHP